MEHHDSGASRIRATVRRAKKGGLFSRQGRGFSVGELAKAGLTVFQARKSGLPVDPRRRSIHDFNVEALREFSSSRIETAPMAKKPVRQEEEMLASQEIKG